MAEQRSILESLWQLVTPRSAEAVITATPQAHKDLTATAGPNWQGRAPGRAGQRGTADPEAGAYLLDMYQRIVQQAQAHPKTVDVFHRPGLSEYLGAVGAYDPVENEIGYETTRPTATIANTLAHELIHFLNQQTSKQAPEVQHALIKKLLGTDREEQPGALRGYQPGAFSPVEHSIINEWLGGPRDWPR